MAREKKHRLARACLFGFEGLHVVNADPNIMYRRHLARLDVCATRPLLAMKVKKIEPHHGHRLEYQVIR
jgi:hypothetical protein